MTTASFLILAICLFICTMLSYAKLYTNKKLNQTVQYLLAHDVDLWLEVLVPANGIVELDLLVCEHVEDVPANDFLLVKVLLAGDHLLDLVLLLVELSEHLLALIFQNQVSSIIINKSHPYFLSCSSILVYSSASRWSRCTSVSWRPPWGKPLVSVLWKDIN